jgi:hypothetical protein
MVGMADHPHTIDHWDDATGENLIEQIAGVGGDVPGMSPEGTLVHWEQKIGC